MQKVITRVFGVLLLLFATVGTSQAALYSYYDATYDITYSLDFTGGAGNSFTLTGSTNSADLFAAAFNFKFSGNDVWTLSSLSPTLIDGNTWNVASATTEVYAGGGNFQALLTDNRVGFYNYEASNDAGADATKVASVEINEGLPQTFTFDLLQTANKGLDAIGDSFAFKVLYLTNDGEEVQFQGWLSKELTVPEAGALLLLATGLVGLIGYRRVHRMA